MKLTQLQYLTALEEYGTFSKAASALYVSQPAISIAIRDLEEELGCQLLVRSQNHIYFTGDGEQVLAQARRVLADVDEIYAIVKDTGELQGEFSIGATPHYCNSILLGVMAGLRRSDPQIHLSVEEGDSLSISRSVLNAELDMGVVQLCDIARGIWLNFLKEGLIFEPLFQEEMCVVVGESHPLRTGTQAHRMQELLSYPYATYKNAMNTWISQLLGPKTTQDRIITFKDITLLRRILETTNAYTVVPRRSLPYGNRLYLSDLYPVELDQGDWTTSVGLVYRPQALTRIGTHIRQLVRREGGIYNSRMMED